MFHVLCGDCWAETKGLLSEGLANTRKSRWRYSIEGERPEQVRKKRNSEAPCICLMPCAVSYTHMIRVCVEIFVTLWLSRFCMYLGVLVRGRHTCVETSCAVFHTLPSVHPTQVVRLHAFMLPHRWKFDDFRQYHQILNIQTLNVANGGIRGSIKQTSL